VEQGDGGGTLGKTYRRKVRPAHRVRKIRLCPGTKIRPFQDKRSHRKREKVLELASDIAPGKAVPKHRRMALNHQGGLLGQERAGPQPADQKIHV